VIDHPTSGIDETVHQRHRLGILTITAEADRAEFGYLRDALDLTPGNLSRHLTVLEDAGLVKVEKGYEGRRPRTWVRITRSGRTALAAELDVLAALVRQHSVVARRARGKQLSDGESAASQHAHEADGESAADEAWTAVASAARDAAKAADSVKAADSAKSAQAPQVSGGSGVAGGVDGVTADDRGARAESASTEADPAEADPAEADPAEADPAGSDPA
jgi:DNA-binding MarR family transcriptional regulator